MSDTRGNASGQPPPNLWTISSQRNPYLHNVFVLLGIDPDEGDRAFQNRVRRLSRRLEAGQTIEIHGHRLEEADIARALFLTSNHDEFVAERLLAHTVHRLDTSEFEESLQAIENLQFPAAESLLPLPIHDLSIMVSLLPQLDLGPTPEPQPLSAADFAALAAQPMKEDWITDQ